MSEAPHPNTYYARKKLAENPAYRFRETSTRSPKRWTEEHLTERWADRKARRAKERSR